MAIGARKIDYYQSGVKKNEFANSLQRISDQLRWIDQKLTMKIDNEIADTFYSQQQKIKRTRATINKMKTVQCCPHK